METNALYYGDNLTILRDFIPDESVDFIYLDPPFNSNRDYNVIFKDESGRQSDAQIVAFEDTWHWGPKAETTLAYLTTTARHRGSVPSNVTTLVDALTSGIGKNQMMAYIIEMTASLVELHRVLKSTGSLYLHCDPTASHYLKILLDALFRPGQFRSEIVWRRTGSHSKVRRYAPIHDTILFFTKSDAYKWNYPKRPYMKGHVDEYFIQDGNGWRTNYYGNVLTGSGQRNGESGKPWRGINPSDKGRHWAIPGALIEDLEEDFSHMSQHEKLDRLYELGYIKVDATQAWPMYERYLRPNDGTSVSDIWAFQPYTGGTVFGTKDGIDEDVRWLPPRDKERLGYPTQKPLTLLERMIKASSDPDDIVLDPFCGCGTAIVAAHALGRRWIGIDVTYLAIGVMNRRLESSFGLTGIEVVNRPTEIGWAHDAVRTEDGRYEFQWWALDLVGAMPVGGVRKKGKDRGIDGLITFPDRLGKMETVVVSVKGGKIGPAMVRDLVGVVQRERAAIGLFLTLQESTAEMRLEAAKAGFFTAAGGRDWPRIQILTIDELLNQGKVPALPAYVLPPYPRASRIPVAVGVEQQTYLDPSGQPIVRRAEDSPHNSSAGPLPPAKARARRKRTAAS